VPGASRSALFVIFLGIPFRIDYSKKFDRAVAGLATLMKRMG
jgi:hypothetical protein